MPRLHINGVPVDRFRLQRRIADERIAPLTFPLDPDTADHVIDVKPDDAWLPLAVAIAERMRHLWSLVTLQPSPKKLIPEGEYLYLVLHTSLGAMVRDRPELEDVRALLDERIPAKLPSTFTLNDNYQDNHDWIDDSFEDLRSNFAHNAVHQRIMLDTRTVAEIMKPFDRAMDRIELTHYEHIQSRIESLYLTDLEKRELAKSLATARHRVNPGPSSPLAMALEVVARIEEIWDLLYGDPDDLQRFPDDESTYQAYRMLLIRLLNSSPKYHDVLDPVRNLLPRRLPPADDLLAAHPDLVQMPARLDQVRTEIIAGAAWVLEPTRLDHSREPDLDGRYEELYWEWEALEDTVEKHRSPRPQARTVAIPTDSTSSPAKGRPKKHISYEAATRAWWTIRDLNEHKSPSDSQLAVELSTAEETITVRTFRRRRAHWRDEGLPWPGPRPKDP